MLNGGKAVRDRDGKIIESAAFQKTEAETEMGRVQPDKRWFGEFVSLLLSIFVSLTNTHFTLHYIPRFHLYRKYPCHFSIRIGSFQNFLSISSRKPICRLVET